MYVNQGYLLYMVWYDTWGSCRTYPLMSNKRKDWKLKKSAVNTDFLSSRVDHTSTGMCCMQMMIRAMEPPDVAMATRDCVL